LQLRESICYKRVTSLLPPSESDPRTPAGTSSAPPHWQALSTNNIDMSSTESSGASAEATATTQPTGVSAPAPSFGSTRGSGLARGKRPSSGPASTAAAATPTGYKPTAIEILNAPREYQNPFAPATPEPVAPAVTELSASVVTPAAVPLPSVAVAPAPIIRAPATARVSVKPTNEMFPLDSAPAMASAESDEPAELNILPPERAKSAPAQTWESEGFKATRAPREERTPREERPRQEERAERSAPVDLSSIPEKFLYVRPGYNYVPTPSNYGGAPRESRQAGAGQPAYTKPASSRPAAAAPAAPASRGGIFGWIKSLFSDSSAPAAPVASSPAAQPTGDRPYHRNRGGQGGGQGQPYEGGQRRSRGGRGRGQRGGSAGGSAAS